METFIRVDYEIFWAIWRWSRRRHPRKSAQWAKNRYFLTTKSSRWAFYGDIALNDEPKLTRLFLTKACRTYFQKHVKVKAKANPYAPEWEAYFEKRLDAKMLSALKGREDLRHLWYSQKGICPVCKEKITQEAGWHCHHIWRVYGGGDGLANRVMLHHECHRQVHSRGLHVEKPRLL